MATIFNLNTNDYYPNNKENENLKRKGPLHHPIPHQEFRRDETGLYCIPFTPEYLEGISAKRQMLKVITTELNRTEPTIPLSLIETASPKTVEKMWAVWKDHNEHPLKKETYKGAASLAPK